MNATAAVVWELCDGTRDVAAIKELLRGAYPDAGDGLDDDVDRALASFRAHQCLEG
ncbi:MAG: PqqD family peptide modification chaperone [Polyangiaceae bacterium]